MIIKLEKEDYYKIEILAKFANSKFTLSSISDNEVIYVYIINDIISGFIQIYNNFETVEIINIAVEEKYRNQGIGTSLLNYVLSDLTKENAILEVRESNTIAKNFYIKNGFKVIRIIKNYYDNENGLSMERSIK